MTARSNFSRYALILAVLLPSGVQAGAGFHSVHTDGPASAWTVGDSGVVYRTFDGGQEWHHIQLGVQNLRGVAARGSNVTVIGDGGAIWHSADSGSKWCLQTVLGAPDLHDIHMASDQVGYAVGSAGTVLRTNDGGNSWTPLDSGTAERLNAVRFADEQIGWAVGENGTARFTSDGGGTWSPVSLETKRSLYSVDQRGSVVWIVGAGGTAFRSEDGGVGWTPVELALEARSDVRTVCLGDGVVTLAGGGGFIRRSWDSGRTWEFPVHEMQGSLSDVCFVGNFGVAASRAHRVPMATLDGGATWRFPAGATLARIWEHKLSFTGIVRGNTFALNNLDPSVIYCALGPTIYRSGDEGETWEPVATIPEASRTNAFVVSPKDTNLLLAAVSGVTPRRLVRSDDRGLSWRTTLVHDFFEYGVPLEQDRDRPDTLFFGGASDRLYRSIDGGQSWRAWSEQIFRAPNDLIVVPDSGSIVLVGDGLPGSGTAQYFKSTDGGRSFSVKETRPAGASMIPGMACGRLRNSRIFGTNWGQGGVQRSTDYGESWTSVSSEGAAYGVDVARDDPNLVIFGAYSGGETYLSLDGGERFVEDHLAGSNYSLYARDRGLILAAQSNGIHKMAFRYSYTPSSYVAVPETRPAAFALDQNHPNPFTDRTRIEFHLPVETEVRLDVFDVRGRRIATLVRGVLGPGSHGVSFGAGAPAASGAPPSVLSAGVYYYRLQAGSFVATRRMLRLR